MTVGPSALVNGWNAVGRVTHLSAMAIVLDGVTAVATAMSWTVLMYLLGAGTKVLWTPNRKGSHVAHLDIVMG